MTRWIQRLHIFAGLQTCIALVLFGIAGLAASWPAEERAPLVRDLPFDAPPHATDRQLADRIYARVRTPVTSPVANFALHRNEQGELDLSFYTPRGVTRAVLHEPAHTLHLEEKPASFVQFLANLHTVTLKRPEQHAPRLLVLWSLYTELSIFSLLFLALSGMYQWIALRASARLGQLAFAAGLTSFIAVYVWVR